MRSGGESGITEVADDIPSLDSLSFLHDNLFHVGVHRFVAETMINDNVTTVPFVKLAFHDKAVPRSIDRCAYGSCEIHAGVKLHRFVYRVHPVAV